MYFVYMFVFRLVISHVLLVCPTGEERGSSSLAYLGHIENHVVTRRQEIGDDEVIKKGRYLKGDYVSLK